MIKLIKYVFLFFLITSCGFKPIYISDKSNFTFKNAKVEGDIKLSNVILKNLNTLKNKDGKFDLIISSNYKKIISSKDKKGNPEVYDMSLIVNLIVKNDNEELKNKFKENLSYNNLSSKFELKQYEDDLKMNLTNKITQDIIIYLNSIQNDY